MRWVLPDGINPQYAKWIDTSGQSLSLPSNSLSSGDTYTFEFEGGFTSLSKPVISKSSFQVACRAPPEGGLLECAEPNGYELFTRSAFLNEVFCLAKNWVAELLPLQYRMSYYLKEDFETRFEKHVLLVTWHQRTDFKLRLPVGDPDNDYKMFVVLNIKDGHGLISAQTVEVTSRPPSREVFYLNRDDCKYIASYFPSLFS